MSSKSHIRKVAIVGAGGNQGKFIVDELLQTGQHEITALSRIGSNSVDRSDIKVVHIDYDSEDSLVAAMNGQDALVIAISAGAPPDTSEKLIQAAARAEVPWILPNEWGMNSSNVRLGDETILGAQQRQIHELIEKLEVSSWIAISCGAWYEHSLSRGLMGYGFDFANKKATFFDDGNIKISTSTWEQTGRAAARVLSLPKDDLENFRNKHVFVQSFLLSQRDMLDSVLRVTGAKADEWEIKGEPVQQKYSDAMAQLKGGDRSAFVKMLYSRLFYPDEPCNFERHEKLANKLLGLPVEDLDACTRRGMEDRYNF